MSRSDMQPDSPVFIVGSGRSGTTILFDVLSRHPTFGWFSQFNEFLPLLAPVAALSRSGAWRALGGSGGRQDADSFLSRIVPRPASEANRVWNRLIGSHHRAVHLTDADVTERHREEIPRFLSRTLRWQGRSRFLNKCTTNTIRTRFLLELFPDARLIHLVRDGRAVIRSLLGEPWWADLGLWWNNRRTPSELVELGESPFVVAARHWRVQVETLLADRAHLPAGVMLQVRYEELCDDPVSEVERILDFVGVATDRSFLDLVERFGFRNRDFKWHEAFDAGVVAEVERELAPTLSRLGYLDESTPADGSCRTPGASAPAHVPRLLYVAGYGRSGSTILARMLGAHPDVEAVGEIGHLPRFIRDGVQVRCSCGAVVRDCPKWSPVLESVAPLASTLTDADLWQMRGRESLRSLLTLGRGSRRSRHTSAKERYSRFHRTMFEALTHQSPNSPAVVIDSSKTDPTFAARPLELERATPFKVKVLHVSRDGRAVLWSRLRRIDRSGGLRNVIGNVRVTVGTCVNWSIANLAARYLRRHFKEDYKAVTYESLMRDPRAVVEEILQWLDLDPSPVSTRFAEGDTWPRDHQLAGNRVRLQKEMRLNYDGEWHQALPTTYRLLFWLIGGPVALLLGRGNRNPQPDV